MTKMTLNPCVLPFSMLVVDNTSNAERGYELTDINNRKYDPATQVTQMNLAGGGTSPTTYSSTGSTGIITTDTDESADDSGTD